MDPNQSTTPTPSVDQPTAPVSDQPEVNPPVQEPAAPVTSPSQEPTIPEAPIEPTPTVPPVMPTGTIGGETPGSQTPPSVPGV